MIRRIKQKLNLPTFPSRNQGIISTFVTTKATVVKFDNRMIGRSAVYVYLQFISSMVSGFIFWIFLSQVSTTETIGTYSLIYAISEIFANIALLGIPDGMQRFVGRSFSEKKLADVKVFVKISFLYVSLGILISNTIIILFRNWFYDFFGIDFTMIIVINLVIASYVVYTVLYSIIIASLKTKVLPIIIIVSSTARVILGIVLVMMNTGVVGLTLGYSFFGQTLSSALLAVVIARLLRNLKEVDKPTFSVKSATKSLLKASVVVWMPGLITILGLQLGTLVLYGTQGPDQSGVYFITIMLVGAINMILYSLFTIALPVLSSIDDGRKRFAWQTLRLSSIFTIPLSSSLIFYSKEIMQLLGSNYSEGSLSFQILLTSVFPNVVLSGVDTLVYAYGQYRRSLAINFSVNIPRVVLYFVLVPIYGTTGAALSYTLGSIFGFAVSLIIARRVPMRLSWKTLTLILLIPITVGFILAVFDLNYIVGITATIVISYIILVRLHIFSRSDMIYIVGLLPDTISEPLMRALKKIKRTLAKLHP